MTRRLFSSGLELVRSRRRDVLFVLGMMLLAVLMYTYRLRETMWFEGDSARDTLQSLRILVQRDFTLIGPPLSFGQNGLKEIYFGSFVYYWGALGLLLTGNSVFGPVVVTILLMVMTIPCLYHLFFLLSHRSDSVARLATFLTVVAPLTIIHVRFFWNPNFIISGSIIMWWAYAVFMDRLHRRVYDWLSVVCALLMGAAAGYIVNFHYFAALSVVCILVLVCRRSIKAGAWFVFGLILGLSPLILFELTHRFYLTQAIVFNLTHPVYLSANRDVSEKLIDMFRGF